MGYADVKTTIPGPNTTEMLAMWKRYEADKTGRQAQVAISHGEGAMLYDVDGNAFIDWTSGVLVANVGHCHPNLVKAVQEASARVLNVYEYCHPYRARAAKDLVSIAPAGLDTCFFLTTGSEATDNAARIMKRASGKFEIISFYGSFHGRTLSTASMGGLKKTKKNLGPMMPGSIRVPYPYCYRCPFQQKSATCGFTCLSFLQEAVDANSSGSVAGMIVEPYLGTGGFIFPPKGYLPQLEKLAREMGALFTLDEVQSSFGRTGTMWACEHEGLRPDIITAGKGIGSGAAVSALLMRSEVVKTSIGKGDLGSTYGGNPVSCAAVSAVIDIIEKENLLENVKKMETIFEKRMPELLENTCVGDVRGQGMVWGIELVKDKESKEPAPEALAKLVDLCAQKGLLIGGVGLYGNVVRVAPPLVICEEQLHESLDIMKSCIAQL